MAIAEVRFTCGRYYLSVAELAVAFGAGSGVLVPSMSRFVDRQSERLDTAHQLELSLNTAGREGWELAHVDASGSLFYFKRLITPAKEIGHATGT